MVLNYSRYFPYQSCMVIVSFPKFADWNSNKAAYWKGGYLLHCKKRFFGVYCCLRHRAILQVSQSLLMLHSSENSCYCFFDWCGIPASRSVCATVPSCVPFIFVMNLYWIHIFTNIRCPHRLLLPSTMKKGVGGDVIWLVAMTNRLKYISGRWMGWPIRPPRSLVLLKRRKHVYSSRHSVRYNVGCKLIGNSG